MNQVAGLIDDTDRVGSHVASTLNRLTRYRQRGTGDTADPADIAGSLQGNCSAACQRCTTRLDFDVGRIAQVGYGN